MSPGPLHTPQASSAPTQSSSSSQMPSISVRCANTASTEGVELVALASQSPAGMSEHPPRRSPGPLHAQASRRQHSHPRRPIVSIGVRSTITTARARASVGCPRSHSRRQECRSIRTRRSRQGHCAQASVRQHSHPGRHKSRQHRRRSQSPPHAPRASSWFLAVTVAFRNV